MRPLILPASTSNALIAGAFASLVVWAAKQWGGIDVPDNIRDAIIVIGTAAAGHFTVDSPPAPAAREAVEQAAADADIEADKKK